MLTFSPCGEKENAVLARRAKRDGVLAVMRELSEEETLELRTARTDRFLFVRLYDGKTYEFLLPIPLACGAKIADGLRELEEYAVWQEIPLCLTDVPRRLAGKLLARFPHVDADRLDEEGRKFSLRVKTELMLLEELPTLEGEGILLSPLTEEDAPAYETLCRGMDASWGYDFREDEPDADGAYFLRAAEADFAHRAALTLAVRLPDGTFVGETTLHAFNGRGGAEFSVRILPAYRRHGYARAALYAITDYAFDALGLTHVLARCRPENTASLAMLRAEIGEPTALPDGTLLFTAS